jgi:hypothetical protein
MNAPPSQIGADIEVAVRLVIVIVMVAAVGVAVIVGVARITVRKVVIQFIRIIEVKVAIGIEVGVEVAIASPVKVAIGITIENITAIGVLVVSAIEKRMLETLETMIKSGKEAAAKAEAEPGRQAGVEAWEDAKISVRYGIGVSDLLRSLIFVLAHVDDIGEIKNLIGRAREAHSRQDHSACLKYNIEIAKLKKTPYSYLSLVSQRSRDWLPGRPYKIQMPHWGPSTHTHRF